jgi:hypothetical protein
LSHTGEEFPVLGVDVLFPSVSRTATAEIDTPEKNFLICPFPKVRSGLDDELDGIRA